MLKTLVQDILHSGIAELAAAASFLLLAIAALPTATPWAFFLFGFVAVCILAKGTATRVLHHFAENEFALLGDIRSAMAQLYHEKQALAEQVDELATVREVALAVGSILDFNEMIRAILDLVTTHFGISKALIYLCSQDEETLNVVGARAHGEDIPVAKVLQKRVAIGNGIVGRAAAERRELVERREDQGVIVAVPLVAKNRVVGVLKLFDRNQDALSTEWCRKLHAVAGAIAIALENSRLYRLAVTDGLTGLYVHRHFQQRLEEEFQRSVRYNAPLSVLLLDIDHFKKFNDSFGHTTGDLVLRGVAMLLQEEARSTDVVCRYGGEEMSVICPETDRTGALQLAERIRRKIEEKTFRDSSKTKDLQVTVSIGVGLFTTAMEKRSEIIERADEALYEAKRNGRNRVEIGATPEAASGAA